MMTLREQQSAFLLDTIKLFDYAHSLGFELTYGDAYRDPRVHGKMGEKKSYSSANSKHKQRLAIDINLFRNGEFLQSTEAHAPLGEFWESIGHKWGGRWNDGNHYED